MGHWSEPADILAEVRQMKAGDHTWTDGEMKRTIDVYRDYRGAVPPAAISALVKELNGKMRAASLTPDLTDSKVRTAIRAVAACETGSGRRPRFRLRHLWTQLTGKPCLYTGP